MTPPSDRDEWLMAQVADGKRDCLEPLVRRYAGPLLTFLTRMTGDRHRSEELFQEVFFSVWIKRRQYQFPRSFKAWLYAIALNQCRAAFRAPALRIVSAPMEEGLLAPAAKEPSPEEKAVAVENAGLVAAAVARLPPRQRAVVVLRIWQGLSYDEIADTLGRTSATVRTNMHHALAALREYLEPRLG